MSGTQGVLELGNQFEQTLYGADEKRRGAIYTRLEIVDFMLDLIGYTPDVPIHNRILVEPSFGGGRFVLRAVDRLITSWRQNGGEDSSDLFDAIRAVELDDRSFERFQIVLFEYLVDLGFTPSDSERLVGKWLLSGDFLQIDLPEKVDFVIGNPPYVRPEQIDKELLVKYRSLYPTMVGRADLYVAFMERSLDLLADDAKLSFICADAWMKNDYGKAIRSKISQDFSLIAYVDMYGLDAFETSVSAYPSVTVIEKSTQPQTRIVRANNVDDMYFKKLCQELLGPLENLEQVSERSVMRGELPWLVSASEKADIIAHLEARYPDLHEAGCRVGIGVATGADKVFIGPFDDFDVESDRVLPLATNKCVSARGLEWSGKGIINPWLDGGGLVSLKDYPKLSAYLESHRQQLSKRHTAKSDVARKWYKTIDRITPSLLKEPKLLIPDIKGNSDAITYDPGTLYPHHNLYFITSTNWNLRALQALLRGGIAQLFVEAYSVKIGGGYLRFQAQNLKRIRVPQWDDIEPADQQHLIAAGEAGQKLSAGLLERIYGLEEGKLAFLKEGQ